MVVGVIGIGKIGLALINSFLRSLKKEEIIASDKSKERCRLAEELGISVYENNSHIAKKADIVWIAVKPQEAVDVLEEISPFITEKKIIVSVIAGLKISKIISVLKKNAKVIRVMPNLPLLVNEGAIAVCKGTEASEEDINQVVSLLSTMGKVIIVEENKMDAITGLSGSGPAYVSLFIEAMVEAGVRLGLKREDALILSAQTVMGTAKMVLLGKHPAILREEVTSPAGTTAEGMFVLERWGVRAAVMEAIYTAYEKSKRLGDEG
ncbi:MAG: pyrroline-5-carboxylate reductase [Candidatus Bathyarchaeia archaeon]